MKETDLSYAAGIIDGEGTITLSHLHSNTHRAPIVSVASTSKELLDWLHINFKGHICSHKTYKEHHKKSWSWRLSSNSSLSLLKLIIPYLKEKSKSRRARLLLKFYKKLTPRNGKYSEVLLQKKLKFEKVFLSS